MSEPFTIPEEEKNKYIERRKKDLANCRLALTALDFKCFATVGHQMKGNAVTFGFDELATIGVDMEKMALSKDVQKLAEILNRFDAYLDRV